MDTRSRLGRSHGPDPALHDAHPDLELRPVPFGLFLPVTLLATAHRDCCESNFAFIIFRLLRVELGRLHAEGRVPLFLLLLLPASPLLLRPALPPKVLSVLADWERLSAGMRGKETIRTRVILGAL